MKSFATNKRRINAPVIQAMALAMEADIAEMRAQAIAAATSSR
jgi:hypothetical protein